MDSDLQHIAQIEAYLGKEMTPEEQAAFEGRMDNDPALAQEVQNWLAAKYVGFEAQREQFKQDLANRYVPQESRRVLSLNNRQSLLAAAAVLVLLIVLAGLWMLSPSSSSLSGEDMIAEVYVPVQPSTNRSLPDAELLTGAHTFFNFEQYSKAQATYLEWLSNHPDSTSHISLYLGQTYLVSGQSQLALEQFRISTAYPQEAEWFSALAMIQMEDWASARLALEFIISNPSHHFHSRAQELLKMIPAVE